MTPEEIKTKAEEIYPRVTLYPGQSMTEAMQNAFTAGADWVSEKHACEFSIWMFKNYFHYITGGREEFGNREDLGKSFTKENPMVTYTIQDCYQIFKQQ